MITGLLCLLVLALICPDCVKWLIIVAIWGGIIAGVGSVLTMITLW